jgi:hypothetical protein
VDVSHEGVRLSVAGQMIRTATKADLERLPRVLRDELVGVLPAVTPSGGAGLLVHRASVEVEQLTVEPLPR